MCQREHVVEWDWLEDQPLVGFRPVIRRVGRQLRGQEHRHQLAGKAGGREESRHLAPLRGVVAGLLGQLALRCGQPLFERAIRLAIQCPCRQLEQCLASRVSVLPDQQQAPVGQDGDDRDGTRVEHHVPAVLGTVGVEHRVAREGHVGAAMHHLSVDETFGQVHFTLRSHCFGVSQATSWYEPPMEPSHRPLLASRPQRRTRCRALTGEVG